MNKAETLQILSSLRAAFPNAYKGLSMADGEAMVALWGRLFADDSYKDVAKAVDALIVSREWGWTPSIGEVKAEMAKNKTANIPTEDEAWQMVRRAVRNSLYNSEKEFKKLKPHVQKAVGAPWQLKEWANFTDADMDRVSYSFKKNYREIKDTEIRDVKLPENVRSVASGVADKLRLTDG